MSHYQPFSIGYELTPQRGPVGLLRESTTDNNNLQQPILMPHEGHALTIAPTGSGKTRSSAIPAALTHEGSLVVFDVKGEIAPVTAQRRRNMGQEVIVLDPFKITDEPAGKFNPLELLTMPGIDAETEAEALAKCFGPQHVLKKDPFWDIWARSVISAATKAVNTLHPAEQRTGRDVVEFFMKDDFTYDVAVLLDKHKDKLSRSAYSAFASYLQAPERETRPSIFATVQSHIQSLQSEAVLSMLGGGNDLLTKIREGEPITIYLCMPPDKMDSHSVLLRMVFLCLTRAVIARKKLPDAPTLFLIDEAFQLGEFEPLSNFITLCRGYGANLWTFWQDLSQLKSAHPYTWESIVNNSSVQQYFGVSSRMMAKQLAELLMCTPEELLRLGPQEQLLILPNRMDPVRAKRRDYVTEPVLRGYAKPHPMHGKNEVIDT